MRNYRDLKVWQKAHQLVLDCYAATRSFPAEERYGITSQIRRCSFSIPANITEGAGRRGDSEFHRFLQISAGSCSELTYFLLLSRDLEYLSQETYTNLDRAAQEVFKMLAGLIAKVEPANLRSQAKGAGQ
jgi:four helix bundle protein